MLRFKKEDGSSYPEPQEHRLDEYLSFKNGLNVPKEKFGTGIKYISVLDILNNPVITYDIIEGLVDIDEDMLQNFSVEYGDILFQRSSETKIDAGKSNVYVDKEKIATFGGFVIRGKKMGDYNPEYMNYLLRSSKVRKQIMRKAQGEQHVNVGQEILSEIRVDMHCKEEQERIANILSDIDRKISAQETVIDDLRKIKKGTMQKIFSQEIRFKDDDGNDFPEWQKKSLESNFELVVDNRGKTPPLCDTGYPLIEISAVGNYFLEYDKIEKHVNQEIYDTWFRKHLQRGDILFSTVGNTALCSYYDEKEKCCVAQNIVGLRFDKNIDSRFMFYMLTEEKNQRHIKSIQMNAVQPSIKVTQFVKLEFLIPYFEEQKKIADCLSALDRKIVVEKKVLEDWKQMKKAMT